MHQTHKSAVQKASKHCQGPETKHTDPRSGAVDVAAAVALTATTCLNVAARRLPIIGQTFDLPAYDWSSIRLT